VTWVRLDEEFPDHPKVAAAGPLASWLHVCALAYCNRYLTDGFVPVGQVPKLADLSSVKARPAALAETLVEVGMWEREPGGFRIHDYHDYQPSKAEVEAERRAKSAGGKKGAARRWAGKTKAPPIADAMGPPMAQPMGNGMGPPMADPMAERCPVPVPINPSLSLLSDSRPATPSAAPPGGGGEGKSQVEEPGEAFVERIVARLGGQRRHRAKAAALVARWLELLDVRLIDQAVGLCEQAEETIHDVGYFDAALRRTAGQYGVEVASA
jgi:hypothetical protein